MVYHEEREGAKFYPKKVKRLSTRVTKHKVSLLHFVTLMPIFKLTKF